jgi:predicted nucleotidyltransferase
MKRVPKSMGYELAIDEQIAPVLRHLELETPGDVAGVYLFGSAGSSELRPDSDVDLLVLTRRSLSLVERTALVQALLAVSGWRGHAERFPEAAVRRPIELTSLVIEEGCSWMDGPSRDFQYGEWLREELVNGHLPVPATDPDVIILAATARAANRVLSGPRLDGLLAPVSRDTLRRALLATIPDILEGVEGDERNTLLTLARILVTLETGQIVSKDVAAEAIAPTLTRTQRELLERARDGYLGLVADNWSDLTSSTTALTHTLAGRARLHGRA